MSTVRANLRHISFYEKVLFSNAGKNEHENAKDLKRPVIAFPHLEYEGLD
ncbi:MAG: hypothetical protein ACJ70U_04230 [Nitrososphaera sp.]